MFYDLRGVVSCFWLEGLGKFCEEDLYVLGFVLGDWDV